MKKTAILLSAVAAVCVGLLLQIGSVTAFAFDTRVEAAVNAAVDIAEDDAHGYSRKFDYRRGNPDYDCSSLVCSVFHNAGFSSVFEWGNTKSMGADFVKAGFQAITGIDFSTCENLRRGDILWKTGHTEIYMGNGKEVGAHWDAYHPEAGDQDDEITVQDYENKGWTTVYRFSGNPADPTFFEYGDADADRSVTANDARLALCFSVGLETCEKGTPVYLACDVDIDGMITAADARLILRASVSMEDAGLWGG